MKKLYPLLPLLLLIISCSKLIDGTPLVGKNGIFSKVNSETPYSGKSLGLYENEMGEVNTMVGTIIGEVKKFTVVLKSY